MTTTAYPTVERLVTGICKLYPSAVPSGIVGDTRHQKLRQGSYHLSRQDCPPRTFSVIRPDDVAGQGPDDAASAFDVSMRRKDLMIATQRVMAVWANGNDPRRKYINAVNGWTGTGDAQRFDMVSRKKSVASPDHKWHMHVSIRRKYVLSEAMVTAILSILRGDTIAYYLALIGVVVAPAPVKRAVTPSYPGRVLRRTTSTKPDSAVKAWQGRMLVRGWKSLGKADGLFGAKTEDVVRRYQKQCRVPVDGAIGPQTWPLPWSRPLG
jgi:peptidoglycan hydrolase-like protein with peptidoglycan-binding domain